MVYHRRIKVVDGIRCLSDVLRPVCLLWRCWFPSSVEVICESYFSSCKALASVTFDVNSRLSRLEKLAFFQSGLQSIHLLGSLELICESCFGHCKSLASVTFDVHSRLYRLEKAAFFESGLQSIHLPGSLEMICESCFSDCHSLTSIALDPCSRIRARVSDLRAATCPPVQRTGIDADCVWVRSRTGPTVARSTAVPPPRSPRGSPRRWERGEAHLARAFPPVHVKRWPAGWLFDLSVGSGHHRAGARVGAVERARRSGERPAIRPDILCLMRAISFTMKRTTYS
jgi:hypothetical protein